LTSTTTVLMVPLGTMKVGGTGVLRSGLRVSNKTNQPSFLLRCPIYVASWAGPGTSRVFSTFSSTTWSSPDENVTSASTNPTPETASRMAAPRPASLALANTPRISCASFSQRRLSLCFVRESQNELTASASTVFLNSSRNLRMVKRGRLNRRLPDVSTLAATVFER